MNKSTDADCMVPVKEAPQETVVQYLDKQIQQAREHLEALCVMKAKAEATQIDKYPMKFLREIVYAHPF